MFETEEGQSTKRIISYLQYLRDVSRKIVSRGGFEKCFLEKANGYALQFEELPDRIGYRNELYHEVKRYCNFIDGTYNKKAFIGYGMVAGTKSRIYAAPILYLECELYEDNGEIAVEPDIGTVRFNYDLVSALSDSYSLSDSYYRNFEEDIDDFNHIERELIEDIESKLESIKHFNSNMLSGFAENVFELVSEKSDIFKDIKRYEYGKGKYQFDEERFLFESRASRKNKSAIGDVKSIFESPLSYIAANHLFVSRVPDALSTYKALDAFVQTIQKSNFDNSTLEKLLINALSGDKRQIGFLDNQDDVQNAINSSVPLSLSSSQIKAIKNAWLHDISYIQGPPGTGKSHTISALVLTALAMNKKVLVVSQKSAALKVVKEKVEPLLTNDDDTTIGMCYYDGEIKTRAALRNYCKYLSEVFSSNHHAEQKFQDQIDNCQKTLKEKFEELREQEKRLSSVLEAHRAHNKANEDFIRARDRFKEHIAPIPVKFVFVPVNNIDKYRIVLDRVSMLETTTRTLASRLYLKKFKDHLISHFNIDVTWINDGGIYDFGDALIKLCSLFFDVKQAEKQINIDANIVRAKIKNINEDILQVQRTLLKLNYQYKVLRVFFSNSKHYNQKYRIEIEKFCGMLFNANTKLIEQKMSQIDFSLVTDVMPFWAAEIRNIGHLLPLKPGIFDFVIVDEASQVNLAEIIPAFYRGNHICIVGDHAQLSLSASGLTFALKGRYDELCWEKYNKEFLSFKKAKERDLIVSKASILDFIKNDNYEPFIPETMLDEHYRSLPHLARYTNYQFYRDKNHPEGKLLVMTETPQRIDINCFQTVLVQGERGDSENPNAKYIHEEAEEVIKIVRALVEPTKSSKYKIPEHIKGKAFTIGILSMIRDQVNLIKELLKKNFPNALEEYGINPDSNLGIGTAEEFQGNERDIMIISLCLDKAGRSYGFHQDDKRLNVATSRARSFTFIVYSPFPQTFAKLHAYIAYADGNNFHIDSKISKIAQYSITRNSLPPLQYDELESDFERMVCEYLNEYIKTHTGKYELTLHNQVNACGQKRLDFVIHNHTNGKFSAVEVDGRYHFKAFPPKDFTTAHIERMNILTRAGWRIINTPYYCWYNNGWLCEDDIPIFKNELSRIYQELDKYLN
jgi:hypothetical protein